MNDWRRTSTDYKQSRFCFNDHIRSTFPGQSLPWSPRLRHLRFIEFVRVINEPRDNCQRNHVLHLKMGFCAFLGGVTFQCYPTFTRRRFQERKEGCVNMLKKSLNGNVSPNTNNSSGHQVTDMNSYNSKAWSLRTDDDDILIDRIVGIPFPWSRSSILSGLQNCFLPFHFETWKTLITIMGPVVLLLPFAGVVRIYTGNSQTIKNYPGQID